MSAALASLEIDEAEFRQRLAMARRSGSPTWLWPEVPVESWAEATGHLSRAAAAVLAGGWGNLPECDAMSMSVACFTSGLGPLFGWWAERGLLAAPTQLMELLALHLDHARARAKTAEAHARKIVDKLVHSDVPVVVLKGAHTAYSYFPDPATRPASDIDVLVSEDRATQAEVALASAGLECAARNSRESSWLPPGSRREPRSVWLLHADDPNLIDLHRSLNFSPSPGALHVAFDSADPIGTSAPWPLDEAAGVLSQPLLLLHLAAHASGGLHNLTLLRMVELVLVVRQDIANGRLSWDEFLVVGARARALGAAYPALRMAEKLAPGTVPSAVLGIAAELAPPRARAIVEALEPATAQRIDHASIAEHFMWVSGFSGWVRQLRADLFPSAVSGRSRREIYEARIQALIRGRISR